MTVTKGQDFCLPCLQIIIFCVLPQEAEDTTLSTFIDFNPRPPSVQFWKCANVRQFHLNLTVKIPPLPSHHQNIFHPLQGKVALEDSLPLALSRIHRVSILMYFFHLAIHNMRGMLCLRSTRRRNTSAASSGAAEPVAHFQRICFSVAQAKELFRCLLSHGWGMVQSETQN